METTKPRAKEILGVYSCRFLEAGIVSYNDMDAGVAYLPKSTMDRMAPSFIGKPLVIQHKKVTPENDAEVRVGTVFKTWFNPEDGWYWCDFVVNDAEAVRCIDELGYNVSCAYDVLDLNKGGLWHDIEFDAEIADGEFTHLALVENPRYEEAKITKQLPAMLVNGKVAHYINQEEEETMFSIFKKKTDGSKEDISKAVCLVNGKEIPVAEIIKAFVDLENSKKVTKENEKEQKYMAKDTDIVDIGGRTYTIADLKNSFEKKNEKETKDEEKEEKKENEKDEKEDKDMKKEEKKENEKEEGDKEEKKEDKKENSKKEEKENSKDGDKFFVELHNASEKVDHEEGPASPAPRSREERAQLWASKHSKKG